MAGEWYYSKDGQQFGPVSMEELQQLASSGQVRAKDVVFKAGMANWAPASSIPEIFGGGGKPSEPSPVREREPERPPQRERRRREPEDSFGDYAPGRRPGQSSGFADFLLFRRMITPYFVIGLFWLGVAASVLSGLFIILSSFREFGGGPPMMLLGLLTMIVGPVMVRIYCELLILLFRINETLTDIRNNQETERGSRRD
jgi:hypothetical protein